MVYSCARNYLLLFSFLGFAVGWALYRLPTRVKQETLKSFFLYERKMPQREFIGTLVTTNVGFFSSVAFSSVFIVTMGIGPAIIAVVAWLVGLIWFAYYVPRLLGFFRRGATVHEYIAESYGRTLGERRHLRFYSSIITFLLYLASVGAEVKFTSDVFSAPTGLSTGVLALTLSIAGVIYVSISGYRGVVSTDRLRFWAILTGVAAIYWFVFRSVAAGGVKLPAEFLSLRMLTIGADPLGLLSLLVLLTMYQFCVMDMWERCIGIVNSDLGETGGNRDADVAQAIRRMIAWSAVPFVVLFGAWYAIGLLSLGQHWVDDPNQIIPHLMTRLADYASTGIGGAVTQTLVVLCFSAAALSTIDGFIIAAVQTMVCDWLPSLRKDRKEWDELDEDSARAWMSISRLLVLVVGALAVAIAYTSFGVMSFWVGMYSLMLSFFPAIFLSVSRGEAFRASRSTFQVAASIVTGAGVALIVAILGTFVFTNSPSLTSLPPFAAAGISTIMLIVPMKDPKRVMKNSLILSLATLGMVLMIVVKPKQFAGGSAASTNDVQAGAVVGTNGMSGEQLSGKASVAGPTNNIPGH